MGLDRAIALGHAIRTGLEATPNMPDGTQAGEAPTWARPQPHCNGGTEDTQIYRIRHSGTVREWDGSEGALRRRRLGGSWDATAGPGGMRTREAPPP